MMIHKRIYKKAALFTLISVLFAVLFISIFTYDYNADNTMQMSAVNTRVKVLDDYVKSFQRYTEQSLGIASFSTLDSMYNLMLARNKFYANSSDFNYTFTNCMICGYTNCSNTIESCPNMENHTLSVLISNITTLADEKLNIKTSYSIKSIEIYQLYPFDVEVRLILEFKIYDVLESNYASWNITKTIHQTIPIHDLFDPTIGLNTNNTFKRRLVSYTGVCAYNQSQICWTLNTVKTFYDSQQYRYFSNGTNYIQRFWNGTMPSSCCGIESFVNVSLSSGNNSYVDNYYWTGNYICPAVPNVTILRIDGIAQGFMLDYLTAVRYNVVNDKNATCPS
jgi:hypothetical protein